MVLTGRFNSCNVSFERFCKFSTCRAKGSTESLEISTPLKIMNVNKIKINITVFSTCRVLIK